jgi:hypothetical protein
MNDASDRIGKLFERVVLFGVFITFIALALYAYLGTFSRYGSDDYCLSAFYVSDVDLASRVVDRYQHASSRYTNILFIGLVETLFGWYNVAILPPLMVTLFVFGLYLLLREAARMASLGWSRGLCLFVASLIVFFSLLQTPDLYETLYWRAGMTSHFAPLVFIPLFGVFLLRQIKTAGESATPLWVGVTSFVIAFMLGGFSEPPVALMVTVIALAIMAIWWRRDAPRYRRPALSLLPWALAGALLALITLALAPANNIRLGNSTPGLIPLAFRTFRYPALFILDELKKFPLPTLVSLLLPLLVFFVQYTGSSQTRFAPARLRIGILFVVIAVIAYLLIAASFAPSVYGQNYPVARARFAGRVVLTCALMTEGALLGILLTGVFTTSFHLARIRLIASLVLLLFSIYPLRHVPHLVAEIPIFQTRARAWDRRDANIRAMKDDGIRDLVVLFLPREVMQDLGDRSAFRLNRCASVLYGVDSIVAFGTDNE